MSSVSSTITSGINSGTIDVTSMVSQLMTVERLPLVAINNKISTNQAEISDLGTISSQMTSLQTAARALMSSGSNSVLNALTATSSNTSVFTATSNTSAVAGTYSIFVQQLAQAQQQATAGQSATATFGSGTLTINGTNINIGDNNNSLSGIRDAINSAGAGVTATIVNDGSTNEDGSSTPYRLVITSNTTGSSNAMNISTSGDDSLGSLFASQNMTQTVPAQDAKFTVNGMQITNSSNTVSDAIAGVTLNLASVSASGSSATLTVAQDTSALSTAVTNFTNAYNTLWNTLKTDSSYSSNSPLAGSALLQSLQKQMRDIVDTVAGADTSKVSQLYQIGVTFNQDGTLAVDNSKLSATLATNYKDVMNMFSAAGGYADKISSFVTNEGGLAGTISQITRSLNSNLTQLNSQVDAFNIRMNKVEANYTTMYSALNSTLSSMQSTSDYLTQQLTKSSSS